MKITALIFIFLFFSVCSFANRDSAFKNKRFKIIPSVFKSNSGINSQVVLNPKLHYGTWPRDMDLTEGIILSIGGTFLIPLCLDLYNERPFSELAIGGVAVYGTCVATALIYRFGFKGKQKKKQKKWDK